MLDREYERSLRDKIVPINQPTLSVEMISKERGRYIVIVKCMRAERDFPCSKLTYEHYSRHKPSGNS